MKKRCIKQRKINRDTEFTAPKSAELKGAPKMFEDPAGNL